MEPEAPIYQIKVKGRLQEDWTEWFGGLSISHEGSGLTVLTGPVVDQSALHGLLVKIRDLGLPIVSVIALDQDG